MQPKRDFEEIFSLIGREIDMIEKNKLGSNPGSVAGRSGAAEIAKDADEEDTQKKISRLSRVSG